VNKMMSKLERVGLARKMVRMALIKLAIPLTYKATSPDEYKVVFRVEDANSNGCYREKSWLFEDDFDSFLDLEAEDPNPPLQMDESFDPDERNMKDDEIEPYLFGFTDINQYNRWFKPAQIELLKRNGFNLVERKAAEIRSGKNQIMFIPFEEGSNEGIEG